MALFTKKQPEKKAAAKPKAADASTKELYAADAKPAAAKGTAIGRAYRVLLYPIISEKASHQQQSANQYFFAVAIDSNKIEVARAIKQVYGIAPTSVNIIRMEGKKRTYGRVAGRRKDWKKAVVTLPKGKTISLYEGV